MVELIVSPVPLAITSSFKPESIVKVMYSGVLKNKEGVGGSKVLSFSFSDENTEKDIYIESTSPSKQ